jgi:hypothetical protein
VQVYVFFWFDVEDYVTPESDVALGRLVDIFDRHGLKATFKMVGEKVRGLQRRGHEDILAKLQTHDIGYHTDYHSKPPSISEYMLMCDWEGGMAEFMRREQGGLDTFRQAFRRMPSCYGQPGGAWAPQVYPALRQWGVPVYLDCGPWVRLDGRPHRYCDVLNMLNLDNVRHLGIGLGRDGVRECQEHLSQAVDRLRHTGGEVSLYAHECEFVTRAFWDAINYAGGKDTPREQWQAAPLLAEAEREARYRAMDEFLTFVQSLPDVAVTVASQAPALYPNRAKGRTFTPEQIAQVCTLMADAVTHQECDGLWLSPAEVFGLAVSLLAARVRNGHWPERVSYRYFDGPPKPPDTELSSSSLSLDDLFGTCLYEDAYLDTYRQMPAQVQVGRNWLSPAAFLATIGAALPRWLRGSTDDARILPGDFVQAAYVPDHVSWNWLVFPPDFNGDPLLEMAKLQAWTLKPAPLKC